MLLPNIIMAAGLVASVVAAPADFGSTVPDTAGQAGAFKYPNGQENAVSGSTDQGAALDDLSGEGSQLDDSTSGSGSIPSSGAPTSSPALGASTDSVSSGATAQGATDNSASSSGGGSSGGNRFPPLSGIHCVGRVKPFVLTDTSRKEEFGPKTADRRVIIHVYYPTQKSGSCPTGEAYASDGYADWLRTFLGASTFTKDFFKNFKTNSRIGGNLYCGTGSSYSKRQEEGAELETAAPTEGAPLAGGSALEGSALNEDATALDASAAKSDATVLDAPTTQSANTASANGANCNCPVLLFSHGFNVPFQLNKALIEDVASQGNIVVGIEHLYDSDYAEVPNSNEVVRTAAIFFEQPEIYTLGRRNVEIRAKDTLFVLDQIKKNKIVIPSFGSIKALATKVRMFGHSLGGQLSLVVMLRTDQITAGINMDGWFWNAANATEQNPRSKANAGADKAYMTLRQDPQLIDPFSLVTGGGPQNYVDAMKVQTGAKIMPLVTGSLHFSYTDLTALSIPASGAQRSAFQVKTGPVNPSSMHKIYTGFTNWFFDNTKGAITNAVKLTIRQGPQPTPNGVFYDNTIY